jgi:hypothetical protein
MAAGDEKDKLKEGTEESLTFAQKLGKEATVTWQTLGKTIEETYNAQVELNKTFGQGQERLSEMYKSISDAAPRVARLGGDMKDVQSTMIGIADASRRNVIANTEDVEKLYAATQVVGGSAAELSNAFLDVGVGIEQVGKQLEDSVNYVRSIGGNTKAVMKDVSDNMGQMNRYQFAGGVQGLTKMAAQASMLRFDMKETFALAEKVLDPESAIEVASAFQRLGVSAGNLADPFQLMNMSINDPSGLQDSLADVAKQYTYFDEKTKTFKINPQGVLTLKEMEKQTGVSAKEMSKMGLAAAELDQRLSAVNMAGLNIKEEDKQYLANIAKMGEGGDYEVKLTDDKGNEYTKKLSEVTQTEMDKLIKEQKEGPKTLEEIARSQLTIDEAMLADIRGLRVAFEQGITSPKQVRQGIAGAQRASKTILGETSDKFGKTKDYRDLSEGILDTLGKVATELKEGNKPLTDVLSNGLNGLGSTLDASQKRFTEVLKEVGENIATKLTNKTVGESTLKSGFQKINEISGVKSPSSASPLNASSGNKIETLQNTQSNTTTQTTKGTVDVGGKIEVDVKVPVGMSAEQTKQFIDSVFNDSKFKDYILRLTTPDNSKEPVSKTY